MRDTTITSIDVGSAHIRVLVADYSPSKESFIIRTLTKIESDGLKNGYIINADSAGEAIRTAIYEAEKTSGVRIRKAIVSIGGIGIGTISDVATIAISRADQMVSEFDMDRLLAESEARASEKPNSRIIHTIPAECKIDGKKVLGKPFGYTGNRLELKTLFITGAVPHTNTLVSLIENSGVEVSDIYASGVAESIVTLGAAARNAGVAVANIGAETVSVITWEDGVPTSLKVFPIGSTDITHDIALGLKIPLDEAEKTKVAFNPDLEMTNGVNGKKVGKATKKIEDKKISEIVEARLSDIFELIDTHLKKIGRSGLLPAGIIFTGEGAHVPGLEALAKKQLSLPARVSKNNIPNELSTDLGESKIGQKIKERMERARDPEWSVVLGLAILGMSKGPEESLGIRVAKRTKSGIVNFLRQFLP